MGISSNLQRVIVARLKSAVPAVGGRVLDNPYEQADMPFIRIGRIDGYDASVECIEAEDMTVTVNVFASRYPTSAAAKDITWAVKAALKGWADTDVLTMHPLHVPRCFVMDDPDPGVLHGVVMVEAMVEG